jgi:hypothetical protein
MWYPVTERQAVVGSDGVDAEVGRVALGVRRLVKDRLDHSVGRRAWRVGVADRKAAEGALDIGHVPEC